MKKHLSTIILVLVFVAGLSLLLYPTFANWWNSRAFEGVLENYTHVIESTDNSVIEEVFDEAYEYNELIARIGNRFSELEGEELELYLKQLSLTGDSLMGYITIPSIDEKLPIYHRTNDAVLSAGVGHLEGTSLPIGGESSHAILSGHRGLPSARLFTDLDMVDVGDVFIIDILGRTFTYEIDQVRVVLPTEMNDLVIEKGKDMVTLVTCTPYGVNTHRLLVRGQRIENGAVPVNIRVNGDAVRIEPVAVAPVVAGPILFVVMMLALFMPSGREKR